MSIINGALALSIVFSAVSIQEVNGFSRYYGARGTGPAVDRVLDETFVLFETYEAGIDPERIRERLHWLAVFLKQNPDFSGFIVSYAGQRACSGEAY